MPPSYNEVLLPSVHTNMMLHFCHLSIRLYQISPFSFSFSWERWLWREQDWPKKQCCRKPKRGTQQGKTSSTTGLMRYGRSWPPWGSPSWMGPRERHGGQAFLLMFKRRSLRRKLITYVLFNSLKLIDIGWRFFIWDWGCQGVQVTESDEKWLLKL